MFSVWVYSWAVRTCRGSRTLVHSILLTLTPCVFVASPPGIEQAEWTTPKRAEEAKADAGVKVCVGSGGAGLRAWFVSGLLRCVRAGAVLWCGCLVWAVMAGVGLHITLG